MKKLDVIAIVGVILFYIFAFSYVCFAAEQSKSAEILNLELQVLQEQKKTAETEIGRLNAEFTKLQVQAILTNQNLEKINTQIVEKTREIGALTEKTQKPQGE